MKTAQIRQADKRTGAVYVYEAEAKWDPERKQTRYGKRKLVGHVDPETGEVAPNRPTRASASSPESRREFYGACALLDAVADESGAGEALRRALATEPKFRAENLMITDLLRNDLAMVCEVGTVEVPSLLAVESYQTVHQLVSTVRGRLRDDVTTVGALRALFPAGSMTGAPKLRTMEIIDEVEAGPRGVYSGAFGWLAADGRADLGVVIRSLTTAGDGTYRLGTGGGITVRSEVEEEYAESRWKAERLLRALSSPAG
jgi:hypothetical protein